MERDGERWREMERDGEKMRPINKKSNHTLKEKNMERGLILKSIFSREEAATQFIKREQSIQCYIYYHKTL